MINALISIDLSLIPSLLLRGIPFHFGLFVPLFTYGFLESSTASAHERARARVSNLNASLGHERDVERVRAAAGTRTAAHTGMQ